MRRSVLAVAIAATALSASPAIAECRGVLVRDTVCTDYWDGVRSCNTTYKYYEYCTVSGGGGSTGGGGGGGSSSGSYYDADANGRIDQWRGVIDTSDPCANNIADNATVSDDVGTNYGGTNDTRPSHDGVDLQGDPGDAVYPFMDGTVAAVGWSSTNCGYRVVVNNIDGNRAIYCHMQDGSASHLAVGQRIFAGYTRIGGVGNTGTQPMGYHLHIGVDSSSGASLSSYWNFTDTQPSAAMYNDGGC